MESISIENGRRNIGEKKRKGEEGGEILFSCSSGGNEFSVRSLEGAELSRSKVPS